MNIPLKIKLEIMQSLLDEVNPSLRGVAFDWDSNNRFALLYFYNEGQLTDALEEHYSCIDHQASARFFFDHQLIEHDFKIICVKPLDKLPQHDYWVYRQKKPFIDPSPS